MSRASNHTYETVYILRPSISDSEAGEIHQKIDKVIEKFQGKLVHRDDWGTKELAYLVDEESNGKFFVMGYTGAMGVVEEIERHFKILENVIRFITVAVEPEYEYGNFKKQLLAAEEEAKKNRELRKKAQHDRAPMGDRNEFR